VLLFKVVASLTYLISQVTLLSACTISATVTVKMLFFFQVLSKIAYPFMLNDYGAA